jgi:hypothetical protein
MTTPSFANIDEDIKSEDDVEIEVNDGNVEDLDLEVNDDTNLDVDLPADDGDEVPADTTVKEGKPITAKTPRQKAPEGFVKPVEFAKILSEHLDKVVPPQVVYSYIKNNAGDSARNPFPVHEVAGYAWYIKPEEGLAWWDAKNTRVSASKEARALKAAKPAAPTAEAKAEEPVVEAE